MVEGITSPRAGSLGPSTLEQAFSSHHARLSSRGRSGTADAMRINKMNSETKPSDIVGPPSALCPVPCCFLILTFATLLDIMRYRRARCHNSPKSWVYRSVGGWWIDGRRGFEPCSIPRFLGPLRVLAIDAILALPPSHLSRRAISAARLVMVDCFT